MFLFNSNDVPIIEHAKKEMSTVPIGKGTDSGIHI